VETISAEACASEGEFDSSACDTSCKRHYGKQCWAARKLVLSNSHFLPILHLSLISLTERDERMLNEQKISLSKHNTLLYAIKNIIISRNKTDSAL